MLQTDPQGPPRTKIPDEVAKAIENLIVDNDLQPGDKLPSQSELSARLGVGTRSIREATKSLESRGLLETQHGKGVFVKNINLDFFLETLMSSLVFHFPRETDLLIDLTKTRLIIESAAVYQTAGDPPPGFVPQMATILEEMEAKYREKDVEGYNLLELEFHRAIVDAADNRIITSLYKYLRALLVKCFRKTGYVAGSLDASRIEHREIVEAIIARDPDRARSVLVTHINNTLAKVTG